MEEKFFEAVYEDNEEEVKEIIRMNPDLDVNWRNKAKFGWAALYAACEMGHDSIVSILLAHPDIGVNAKDFGSSTPFSAACRTGQTTCARLMLKDSRVLVNERSNPGYTPFWWAAHRRDFEFIKWWIGSGREMDLGTPGDDRTDAILAVRCSVVWDLEEHRRMKLEIVTLLEMFKRDEVETRHLLRLELGWYDRVAAEMFALVVFVSDGLLQMRSQERAADTPAARFFRIACQLPLELQMGVVLPFGGFVQGENLSGRQ